MLPGFPTEFFIYYRLAAHNAAAAAIAFLEHFAKAGAGTAASAGSSQSLPSCGLAAHDGEACSP